MNAEELLRTWPGVEKANAETILSSSAWQLRAEYRGVPGLVRKAGTELSDTLDLSIGLDGEAHVLRLVDSASFPDLHRLWARRAGLPQEVLLALLEKECGGFLQTLENGVRRQLSLKGVLSGGTPQPPSRSFVLTAGGEEIRFAIDLPPALVIEWGQLRNLDTGHDAVRALTRPARAEYAALDLLEAEAANVTPGGAVILSEELRGTWRIDPDADDLLHVCAAATTEVSFAQIVDDAWPEVPSPDGAAICLRKNNAIVARGTCKSLGLQRAVVID